MKTEPDALGTVENESGRAKQENEIRRPRYLRKWVRERKTWKRDPTLSVPPKTSMRAQNMKTKPDALGIAENMSGNGKHDNEIWRHPFRRKRIQARKRWKRDPTHTVPPKASSGAQNKKMEPDAHGTVENESGSAKH
jgi:hypothetical protein